MRYKSISVSQDYFRQNTESKWAREDSLIFASSLCSTPRTTTIQWTCSSIWSASGTSVSVRVHILMISGNNKNAPFLPPVWSGMCLMHFTPQIASPPDILNKVVSLRGIILAELALGMRYEDIPPWPSLLPGSSGGRDTHQPDPGGDCHLRRDLCPDGPRGRVPGGRPGPAPPPLHIWSVSWHDDTNNKWLSHKYVPQILPQPMPLFRAILSGKLSLLLMWSCGLFRWNKILIF